MSRWRAERNAGGEHQPPYAREQGPRLPLALAGPPAHDVLVGPHGVWEGTPGSTSVRRHADVDAWCAARAGERCRLWLSAAWLHDLACPRDLDLPTPAARLRWAGETLRRYHGDEAADWALADWRAVSGHGVSALHGAALSGMLGRVRAARIDVVRVAPWWSFVLERCLRRRPPGLETMRGLVVVEGVHLRRITWPDGSTVVESDRLPTASTGALRAHLDEMAGQEARRWLVVGHGLEDDAPLDAVAPTVWRMDPGPGLDPTATWSARSDERTA